MVEFVAIPAIAAALFALAIVAKPDVLRLVQGTRHVRARVIDHVGTSDGFVPLYSFQDAGRSVQVTGDTASAKPEPPVGTTAPLNYPAKRPDLAREPAPLMRAVLYAGFAAWIGFFSDLWLGWLT